MLKQIMTKPLNDRDINLFLGFSLSEFIKMDDKPFSIPPPPNHTDHRYQLLTTSLLPNNDNFSDLLRPRKMICAAI